MNISFESITADPQTLANKLNEYITYCQDVKVHSVVPAMDQFQRPVMITLIELKFNGERSKDEFEKKYKRGIGQPNLNIVK